MKEYLPTLDRREKWNEATPFLKVNDIVWLLQDFTPRGIWSLGKITVTNPGKDGVTRRVVTVKTSYELSKTRPSHFPRFSPRNGSLQRIAQSFFSLHNRLVPLSFLQLGMEPVINDSLNYYYELTAKHYLLNV